MKAAIVIPARYASTRLAGKPLLDETGKPLIQHTYEQAAQSRHAAEIIVATDDERIFSAVNAFGGRAVMTSPHHETGSARVAEAAMDLDADIIVNLQGDEPEVDPAHLDRLIEIKQQADCFAATLACPFPAEAVSGAGAPTDEAAVKAILGKETHTDVYQANYFTRSICPYPKDADGSVVSPGKYFLHIGVYAFSKGDLLTFAQTPSGVLEKAERLEQLRILEMGGKIVAGVVGAAAPGIDTPEDYAAFVARARK